MMILNMDVSENSGFSPQIIHFNKVFHCKPSIFGVPLFLEIPTQKRNFLFKDLWGFYSLQYIWRVGGVDPKNGQVTQGSLLQLQATTLSLIKKDMLLFIERILRQYNLVKMTIYIVSIRLNNMLTCRFLIHQHYHSRHPKTSQFSDFSCISLG